MGLFSRKKKNVFDPREQYVPEVEYTEDLTTTLVKTIGIGSKDAKKVVVGYEEDTLTYYFDSGVLCGVESEKEEMRLSDRFYWADRSKYDESKLAEIAQIAEELSLPDFYWTLRENFSEYLELLDPILTNLSFRYLESHYDDKIKSVKLDLLDETEDQKVRALSIMGLEVTTIGTKVEQEKTLQKETLDLLTNSDPDITILHVADDSYTPTNDLQKIVWAAAESTSSLQDIHKLSKGFLWSEVLDTINELSYLERVRVDDPSDVQEESEPLPDLDLILAPNKELPETEESLPDMDLPTDEELVETEEDPFAEPEWEYSTPPANAPKDDGGFVYEETAEDEENDITLTKHLLDDFEFNVKVALAEEDFDRDTLVEVSALLRENRQMEEKTVELEKEISPLQTNYDNRFTSFQHLSVNKVVEEENIVGDDVEELRELSNRSFQELYDLEEERYNVGQERKEVLKKLEKQLINLTKENSQELLHRLNQKSEAIDNIVNLAYHAPKDDEDMPIDPSFLAAIEPSPEDTPVFQQLMQKYGDPFKTLTK